MRNTDWKRLRFGPLPEGVDFSSTQKPAAEVAKMWTNAFIHEVWIYENKPYRLKVARVFAEMNTPFGDIDIHQQTVEPFPRKAGHSLPGLEETPYDPGAEAEGGRRACRLQ
jgi:hypothetical protein